MIINSGAFTSVTKSLNLRTLSDVTLHEKPDGTGTITFGNVNPISSMYAGTSWPGVPQVPAFEMITDARTVYGILRQAQQAPVNRAD